MRIRLTGTPAECRAAAVAIGRVLDVQEVSREHTDRGTYRSVRVYVVVALDATEVADIESRLDLRPPGWQR